MGVGDVSGMVCLFSFKVSVVGVIANACVSKDGVNFWQSGELGPQSFFPSFFEVVEK
jgi:hypothetical protein